MDMKLEAPYTFIEMLPQRCLGQRYLSIQGKEIVSATWLLNPRAIFVVE